MKREAVRCLTGLAIAAITATSTDVKAAASVAVANMFVANLFQYQDLTTEERSRITIATALIEWSQTETIRGAGTLDVYYGLADPTDGHWPGGAFLRANATAQPDGYAMGAYVLRVAIDVTNGTDRDLPHLVLGTDFSAFSPYGSSLATVDRAPLEYALFDTRQYGAGIGDGHGCDTRLLEANGNYAHDSTPPTLSCGVPSPDHSMSDADAGSIRAGATARLNYTLSVTVAAYSVIEPASLALFAPPALAVLALRRRRAA